VHHVAEGCRRFSHAACERALFLAEDETLPRLAPHHADAMARLARRAAPWRTAWVAVPNKTSVYLDPATTAAATRALAQAGAGPDLLAALRHAAQPGDAAPDLYFPNDTHLSPRGARQLGEAVLAWLRAQDPAPPPRPS
jgi:lysophospholipase L1-like esterase